MGSHYVSPQCNGGNTLFDPLKPLLNPLLTQRQRGYGQPLAMQVRIQIVKNLESLTCLEIRKTNQEQ